MAPAPQPSSETPAVSLHASYSSPHPPTSQTFHHPVSAPLDINGSVAAKKAYLSELRGLVTKMQGEINAFLTERMEEDKKAAEAQGQGLKDSEREAKEEENYGEENVEDDA
ncbi:hypothetical protein T310_2259 [Rasamsonia emersonii CBS 393.64]|uniref:EKC/KEOPS complex subunit GON7 n=1 Tax=Rasamsonia emersonii (strain ATCC 16479 / CBS 393.64 / IMI 116815) TaxID=1408163 RepID=A0A0F4YZQ9_RASE3|nr:hypothetical protein T310_2259 [Rasamsonia emersonii CBS 393.64]KKA23719.1 hypothetical protein T310_2259 [Rasamsonia emersonii CBS 393.64]